MVSNFAGLSLKAKVETDAGLGKVLRSRSWSRTSQSRLQSWYDAFGLGLTSCHFSNYDLYAIFLDNVDFTHQGYSKRFVFAAKSGIHYYHLPSHLSNDKKIHLTGKLLVVST